MFIQKKHLKFADSDDESSDDELYEDMPNQTSGSTAMEGKEKEETAEQMDIQEEDQEEEEEEEEEHSKNEDKSDEQKQVKCHWPQFFCTPFLTISFEIAERRR